MTDYPSPLLMLTWLLDFLFPSAWELDPAEGYFPPQSDLQGGHHSVSAYILAWRQFLHHRCAKARLSEFLPSGTLGVLGWNCWAFLTGMEFQLFQNKRLFCFLHVPGKLVTGPAVIAPVGLLSVLSLSFGRSFSLSYWGRFRFCILFMDESQGSRTVCGHSH